MIAAFRYALGLAVMVVGVALAQPAAAAILTGFTLLNGQQERPTPVQTLAQGTAVLTLNTETSVIETFSLLVSGIETNRLMSVGGSPTHIHAGPIDGTGPIVVDFRASTPVGFTGGFILTAKDLAISANALAAILSGDSYVNVHTTLYPAGEIRGQVSLIPLPAGIALLGTALGGLGLLAWRRRVAA